MHPLNQVIMQPTHNKVTMFCLCVGSPEGFSRLRLSIMTEYSFACVTNSVYFQNIYYVMQIKWELAGLRLIKDLVLLTI